LTVLALIAASSRIGVPWSSGCTANAPPARAGVAPQTVTFHTKPELISAVIDDAVMGDHAVVPQGTPWWADMSAAQGPDEALGIFIRGAAPLFAQASAVSEILRAAALTDEEVRATHEFHESLRADAFGQVVQILADKGPLRPELTIDTATDILMTIFGDSTYRQLIAEHSWTHDQVVEWLCQALPALLLQSP
jgi:hypothetical protein